MSRLTKKMRLDALEVDVDDLCYEVFEEQNHNNVLRRLSLLENFKGEATKDLNRQEDNIDIRKNNFDGIDKTIKALYELYERLGQKVKNNREDITRNKADVSIILIGLLKHLGLQINDQGEVIKKTVTKKKNAKPISTSKKTNRRKAK